MQGGKEEAIAKQFLHIRNFSAIASSFPSLCPKSTVILSDSEGSLAISRNSQKKTFEAKNLWLSAGYSKWTFAASQVRTYLIFFHLNTSPL